MSPSQIPLFLQKRIKFVLLVTEFLGKIPWKCQEAVIVDTTFLSHPRMLDSDVIPLPHIYGARIKGVEVFCPLDPPPPYEAVVSQLSHEQVLSPKIHACAQCAFTAGSVNNPILYIVTIANLSQRLHPNTFRP